METLKERRCHRGTNFLGSYLILVEDIYDGTPKSAGMTVLESCNFFIYFRETFIILVTQDLGFLIIRVQ